MKKKILLLLLSAMMCFSLVACDDIIVDNSKQDAHSQQLRENYAFYDESVDALIDDMELDAEHANAVFETLISIGLDEEISHCFDKKDYYTVWWGGTNVDVYLKDGVVERIVDGETELYPNGEHVLKIPSEIIWKDEDNIGIVNLELDGDHTKQVILINYYSEVANYLKELDKSTLKDYSYLRFVGNVIQDNKIQCMIKGNLSIDYIKNTESFIVTDIEDNMTELFIPKPLR